MRENIRRLLNTKEFHIGMVIFIIVIILFIAGVISLKYNVEGEANLPFELSKISIISSVEGTDNEDAQNKWNLTVNQNNDIYLYIKKNDNYLLLVLMAMSVKRMLVKNRLINYVI